MGPIRLLVILVTLLVSSPYIFAIQSDAGRQGSDDTAAALATTTAPRTIPQVIRFGGGVRTASGEARTGSASLTFSIYGESQGGAPIWVETQNVILDEQGRYTVLLGSGSNEGLPRAMFASGEARWLGVRVAEDGAVEQPRVQLVSVPYALTAGDALSFGGRPVTDFALSKAAAMASGNMAQVIDSMATISDGSSAGTANFMAKFESATSIVNSAIFEAGGNVVINGTNPIGTLTVQGGGPHKVAAVGPQGANVVSAFVQGTSKRASMFINASGIGVFESFQDGVGPLDFAVNPAGGNVGIGTPNPAFPLTVEGVGPQKIVAIGTAGNNVISTYVTGTSKRASMFINSAGIGVFEAFQDGVGPLNFAVNPAGGNVGINTPNPIHALTVNGVMTSLQNGQQRTSMYVNGGRGVVESYSEGVGPLNLTFNPAGGNVGIGTSSPSQELEVAGTVFSTSGGFRFPDNTTQTTAAIGTISGVTAGTGLTGGGTSGSVSLAVSPTAVQSRITGTCATGQYVRVVNQDGTVTCGMDQTGAGGIVYPYSSGNQSTPSGAFVVTQTNSTVLMGDPSFSFAQTSIPAAIVGIASATTNTAVGVVGFSNSPNSPAIVGWNGFTGSVGTGDGQGVIGQSDVVGGTGVEGNAKATTGTGVGVRGQSNSASGIGVYGQNSAQGGLAGKFDGPVQIGGNLSNPNGQFQITGGLQVVGNLNVQGTLTKSGGTFKIDHPLDPANKYLYHSFVESPDMMNIYNGVVMLDAKGQAWITMPDWFEALNMEFRYQLTAIGRSAPNLFIAKEMNGNRFKIAGGRANAKVSWQVTGIRHDAWAEAHRVQVEEEKPPKEQGTYLHPELFPKPVVAKK